MKGQAAPKTAKGDKFCSRIGKEKIRQKKEEENSLFSYKKIYEKFSKN